MEKFESIGNGKPGRFLVIEEPKLFDTEKSVFHNGITFPKLNQLIKKNKTKRRCI